MDLTRRDLLTATACAATMAAFPAAAAGADAADAQASALLDRIAERQLADQPGDATQLGLDKGARAALKSRLGDNSAAGQHTIARHLREGLTQLEAVPIDRLGAEVRTHVEVVQEAYGLALDGFAFPYGDVAVGSWRNSPYVVIQNVGAFLDTPRMLDSDHLIARPPMPRPISTGSNPMPSSSTARPSGSRPRAAEGRGRARFPARQALKQIALDAQRQCRRLGAGYLARQSHRGDGRRFAATPQRCCQGQGHPRARPADRRAGTPPRAATSDAGVWKFRTARPITPGRYGPARPRG
jgi:uncharacterized protein (DUF885 family)